MPDWGEAARTALVLLLPLMALLPLLADIQRLRPLAKSYGLDISVACARCEVNKLHSELGSTEVLIYNASAYINAGILELTPEQFEAAWKVNCFGAFLAAQQVLPTMVEQQRGTILLTNATASQKGSARFAALAVGKFGLRALAQSLAREFGPQGIHVVNIVIDGIINTPRTRSTMQERDQQTFLSPDAIAETYWQLYQQDLTAWTLEIDLRPAVEKF